MGSTVLRYVYDSLLAMINSFKEIFPFEGFDFFNGLFNVSMFALIVAFSVASFAFDVFVSRDKDD